MLQEKITIKKKVHKCAVTQKFLKFKNSSIYPIFYHIRRIPYFFYTFLIVVYLQCVVWIDQSSGKMCFIMMR
jgi:hypothetical protein